MHPNQKTQEFIITTIEDFIKANKIKSLEFKGYKSKQNTWLINNTWCNVADVRYKLLTFAKDTNPDIDYKLLSYEILQKLLRQFTFEVRMNKVNINN